MKKTEVYKELKQQILNAKLLPNDVISEASLVKQYQLSRTPIREVIVQLRNDNLITNLSSGQLCIKTISKTTCQNHIFIRKHIEPVLFMGALAKKAIIVAKLEHNLAKQKVAVANQDSASFYELDNLFHKIFYDVNDQTSLYTMLFTNCYDYRRIRVILNKLNLDLIEVKLAEHEQLLNCLINEDLEGFKKYLEDHIMEVINRFNCNNVILNSFVTD